MPALRDFRTDPAGRETHYGDFRKVLMHYQRRCLVLAPDLLGARIRLALIGLLHLQIPQILVIFYLASYDQFNQNLCTELAVNVHRIV